MTNSTKKKFNYENKEWGVVPLKNKYTYFQGLDIVFLKKSLNPYSPNKSWNVVDLGCGGGNIDAYLKNIYQWSITAIDISSKSIATAKKNFPQVRFLKKSAEKIPGKIESLDLIYAFDSLEHFENLDKIIEGVYAHLKEGGIFYTAIPLERQFPTIYWILYKIGWRLKKDKSGHINYFDNKSFKKLVEKYGFKLVKRRYSYHFFLSICDTAFYLIQKLLKKSIAFETEVYQMKGGYKKTFLTMVKKAISFIGYIESMLFWWLPGGKGHFLFVKEGGKDFFSEHHPLTVAEDYQQEFGMKKILQPRDLELIKIFKALKYQEAKKILDFGCANGIWLERMLADVKAKGVGIDISPDLIEMANKRNGKKGTYFLYKKNWPIKPKSVDFCVSFDTFEHINNKISEINHISKSMKKEGRILFYTLNPSNKFTIDWIFERLGSNYMYKRADHNKELFIAPSDFAKLLKAKGFGNINYELYDGIANLVWRVICYIYLSFMEKAFNYIGIEKLMKYVVLGNDWFLRRIVPINNAIDGIFLRRGYSNGYFLWAVKG